MGNCLDPDRPPSTASQSDHESDVSSAGQTVRTPKPSVLKPSILIPIVVQQPIISPPGSPFSLHRPSNHQLPGTPSSSGVSSASSSSSPSSTTSVIISKSSHEQIRFSYVAIFDYDARTKEDLTIRKNDLLEITNRKMTAWWKAKNEHGQEGWIPSNYVAKRDSLESEP